MAEHRWSLYVDESGDFGDPERGVVIGGVLVRGLRVEPSAIREALERIAPGLPWPLHANRLGLPAWLAAAHATRQALLRSGNEFAADRRQVLIDAWHRVRELHPARAEIIEAELTDGAERRKTVDAARFLSKDLVGHEHKVAHAMTRELRADIARVFAGLQVEAFHIVFAGESEVGQEIEGDRYLALLPSLTRRAAKIVARAGGPAVIRLQILERNVADPVIDRTENLHLRHLRSALAAGRVGQVRTVTEGIQVFRGDVDPLLVCADFAANRGLFPCTSKEPLRVTEELLTRMLQRPMHSGEPPRSHLAASGIAEDIEQGKASPVIRPPVRRWAIEQAEAWQGQP